MAVASSGEVARHAEIIVTSLPTARPSATSPTRSAAAYPGRVVIETSTLPVPVKQQARDALALRGTVLLDCPLTGTGGRQLNKDVVAYLSGPLTAKARAERGAARDDPGASTTSGSSATARPSSSSRTCSSPSTTRPPPRRWSSPSKPGSTWTTVLAAVADGAGTSRMFEVRGPAMAVADYSGPGRPDQRVRQGPGDHHRVRKRRGHPHPAVRPDLGAVHRGAGAGPRRPGRRLRARRAAGMAGRWGMAGR